MINSLLRAYKKIIITNSLTMSMSLAAFVFSICYWLVSDLAVLLASSCGILSLILTLRSKRFLNINSANFLEHINRHFPEYQESAQLLEKNIELSKLQQIQKVKIERQFLEDLDSGKLKSLQPQLNIILPIVLVLFSVLNFFISDSLRELVGMYGQPTLNSELSTKGLLENNSHSNSVSIVSQEILLSPPSYTGLAPHTTQQLDLNAIQGSSIEGRIEFNQTDRSYYYARSGRPAVAMTRKESSFVFNDIVEQTALYKFSYKLNDKLVELDGIYTISLIRDSAAKITITSPRTSLVEFSKSDSPQFTLSADIKDDFGINDVTILVSVAKGSGEAVKFRDKQFKFKSSEITPKENTKANASGFFKNATYQRSWSLTELQMEPGDEAYISLHVLDNKQPNNQLSKSSSLIIRWLDEDQIDLALEGIQIRFVPEYFRSQRQIIIETEQLIADGNDLTKQRFSEISTDLGRSQSDLKQKYGQYLGDEFGEGQGAQFGLADGYHGGETMSSGEASAGMDHSEDEHHDERHQNENHPNENQPIAKQSHDQHQHETDTQSSKDLSGAEQLIAQFGHNHSSIEVAPLSQKDPKSYMKMAVNEMWQAELHLMMSEPNKALPYEYEAYKYLKLARQAERVYAKRLGFEPPPVSEERRLTGELKAILEYDLTRVVLPNNDSDVQLFSSSYQLLNQSLLARDYQLTPFEQQILSELSQTLLRISETRTTLIKYAAVAQKIAMAKSLDLKNCINCVSELQAKLWQLIPAPLSRPALTKKGLGTSVELQKRYLEARGDSQ